MKIRQIPPAVQGALIAIILLIIIACIAAYLAQRSLPMYQIIMLFA